MNNNIQNILGNSIDINTSDATNYSEIKADIPVSSYNSLRIWGQVKDAFDNPVPYALLKLIRNTGRQVSTYTGVAHATADCNGFYQFDICPDDVSTYKLLASRPNMGSELVINDPNCSPEPGYNPCPGLSTFSLSDNTCG